MVPSIPYAPCQAYVCSVWVAPIEAECTDYLHHHVKARKNKTRVQPRCLSPTMVRCPQPRYGIISVLVMRSHLRAYPRRPMYRVLHQQNRLFYIHLLDSSEYTREKNAKNRHHYPNTFLVFSSKLTPFISPLPSVLRTHSWNAP